MVTRTPAQWVAARKAEDRQKQLRGFAQWLAIELRGFTGAIDEEAAECLVDEYLSFS